jgi:hypothetical protein
LPPVTATEDAIRSRGARAQARRPSYPSLSFVIGAVVVVVGAYIGAAPLSDNSFFTHLATGRHILESGFPTHDVYSFTAPGERWVVQSWLASVLYAALESTAGLVGIRVLTSLLAGATAGILWALTRPAKGLVARLLISVVGLTIGAIMWSPRPLMIGLLLLGVTLLVAERRLPPPVLLPVFWLWVNSHGSFPLGLLALGCYAVGSRLDGERRPSELRPLGWAVGGTVLGAVNPLGPVLLTFPLGLLQRQDALADVVEWRSPSFSEVYARAFLVLVALAVAALVRRPTWRAAVPLIVFLALSLTAARNIPVAALVVVPGLAAGAAGLGRLDGQVRSRAMAVAAALVLVVGALWVAGRLAQPDLELGDYPVDAVAWLDQHDLLGPETRRVAPDTVGNYLELLLGDRASVFSDDRVDMYPQQVVDDEVTLIQGSARWRDVLERWAPDVVVWERGGPLDQLLATDPGWRLGYSDQRWVVYLHR